MPLCCMELYQCTIHIQFYSVDQSVVGCGALEMDDEPTDKDIKAAIEAMLKEADLATMSMKKVRQDLEEKFKFPMADKKGVIKGFVNDFMDAA